MGGLNKASALPRLFPLSSLTHFALNEASCLVGWFQGETRRRRRRLVGSSGGAEEGREEREGVEELRQTFRSSGGQWYCCSCTPCEGRRGERKEGRERSLRTDTRVCTDSRAHTCSGFPLPLARRVLVCVKRGGWRKRSTMGVSSLAAATLQSSRRPSPFLLDSFQETKGKRREEGGW